jgi:hypothetical protein
MRHRRQRRACLAAAPLAAALAFAAPAGAAQFHVLTLSLMNSDGYKVTVAGVGPTVGIVVHRPKQEASTTYLVHGKVTRTSLKASFSGLGRVDVEFHPTHSDPSGRPRCNEVVHGERGLFRGRIEFHGEGGYTSVDAHRAKGKALGLGSLRNCVGTVSRPHGRNLKAILRALLGLGGPQAKQTRILAEWKQPLGGVFFEATQVGRDRTQFLAAEQTTVGRLAILHIARANGSAKRLASDPALTFANVSPPAPFSGSGDLRHGPDGLKLWTGNLAVSFPGAPDVPLTGPDFRTILSRSWGPVPTVPAPLPKRLRTQVPEQLLAPGL